MSEPKISAADAVYREVKGRILDGSIAGGALISEGEISELLDVSRTPVREAFVRLQAEGWMTLYPKRGALVRAVEPREVRDVVEARIAVESRAARSVVEAQEHRDVAIDLGEILRRQRQSLETGDHDDFTETDCVFHTHLVAAGGNAILTEFYERLGERQRRLAARILWKDDRRCRDVLTAHARLVDLVAAGDATGFEQELTAHLHHSYDGLLP